MKLVKRLIARIAILSLFAAVPAGCGPSSGGKTAVEPLRIAAASDLRIVLPRLVERFKATRQMEVECTFGASGQLAQQVRQGAPFDVFLAANRRFVADLARDGLVRKDSVRDYARGTLVLAIHRDSADSIRSLADLTKPGIKHVAIANPELAPYGMAGKQAIERAGLWEEIAPKIAQSETVAQALQFVQTGNAEAGFVGRSGVAEAGVYVLAVDPLLYDPIIQAMGIPSDSKRIDDAAAFAAFVLSKEGQAILRESGFEAPPR